VAPFVFTSERGAPFTTAGFARMIERAGVEAKFGYKPHPHMLCHACGYALANRGHDTGALQAYRSEHRPEIVSGMRSPRPSRIEIIRIAIPIRFCHKHSTFLTLVNFRFVQCPHRFSAGGTEIEKPNAFRLQQSR
jgi:hypothetical protein